MLYLLELTHLQVMSKKMFVAAVYRNNIANLSCYNLGLDFDVSNKSVTCAIL